MTDDLALSRLVARVEAGEPLDEDEILRLERAALRHPNSPDWALCLSHALVNSDRASEALAAAERAARIRPDEVLVLLARARALAALERYPEAEAALRDAVRRYPGHADALRALALLRLRGGAPAEAERLLERVLETDPLDDWARQILEEAKATRAQGGTAALESKSAFALDLEQALAERGIACRSDVENDLLVVRVGRDQQARLSLASLWEESNSDPRGRKAHVASLAESFSRFQAPSRIPALEEVRGRVFPVLRPPSFLGRSGPALNAPGPAGLLWLYALDHPEFVSYLPPGCAESWNLGLDAIAALAMENLERAPRVPVRLRMTEGGLVESPDQGWDVLGFDAGDGYDPSRLLSAAHRRLLATIHAGPMVAAIPTGEYALLAPSDSKAAVDLLAQLARGQARGDRALAPGLFSLEGGGLTALAL